MKKVIKFLEDVVDSKEPAPTFSIDNKKTYYRLTEMHTGISVNLSIKELNFLLDKMQYVENQMPGSFKVIEEQ